MLKALGNRYGLPVLVAAMMLVIPTVVQACSVCMGSSDELSHGINSSIIFLMAMPFSVAGSIAGVLIYSARRRVRTRLGSNIPKS